MKISGVGSASLRLGGEVRRGERTSKAGVRRTSLRRLPVAIVALTFALAHSAGATILAGSDAGRRSEVAIFEGPPTAATVESLVPFGNMSRGGARVALGDVDGDGVLDRIVGGGPGGPPRVRVLNGLDGSPIFDFFAFESSFRGGVYVAAGDFDGDGRADVAVAPGPGIVSTIRVFDGVDLSLVASFTPGGPAYSFGVRLAVGDVDGDGELDIVAGGGDHPLASSQVVVFGGPDFSAPIGSFHPFGVSGTDGVFVATGDFDGDSAAEIVTGRGGGSPAVKVFDGATLGEIASFVAFDSSSSGVRVAVGDVMGDPTPELILGTGPGTLPAVSVLDTSLTIVAAVSPSFEPDYLGGVFVAAGPNSEPDCSAHTLIEEFPLSTPSSYPEGITVGSDGALWFAERGSDRIGRMTTDGTLTAEYDVGAGSGPVGIAAGPDGALWFAERGSDEIGRLTVGGALTEYPVPMGGGPYGIAVGYDDALWFTAKDGDWVGRITTGGAFTRLLLPEGGVSATGISRGPRGRMWLTELNAARATEIVDFGAGTVVRHATGAIGPFGLARDERANLWIAAANANSLVRLDARTSATTSLPLPPPTGSPHYVAIDRHGAVWFTDYNGNRIGRLATSGLFTEIAVPTSLAFPNGITTDAAGDVWFTEEVGNRIGRVNASLLHDSRVRSARPLTRATIRRGRTDATRTVRVRIENADAGEAAHSVRVAVAPGTCPPGTAIGEVDLAPSIPGIQRTASIAGGGRLVVRFTVTLPASSFATSSAREPVLCALDVTVENAAPACAVEATPEDNTATVALSVVDQNDF